MKWRYWLVVLLLCSSALYIPVLSAQTAPPTVWDPGWALLSQGKLDDAHGFFVGLLAKTPNDAISMWGVAWADFDLKNYDEAVRYLHQAIAQLPNLQGAHHLLIRVYAAQGDWKSFDAERALILDAQRKGVDTETHLIIDEFQVNGEKYTAHAYEPTVGTFHTRYNFAHFDASGKLDSWISCESDDADQSFFAKAHPADAAAGKRSFSLDSYSAQMPDGHGGITQTHGTLKFYPDGEPTYETVRADVIATLQHRSAPMSSTTSDVPAGK